MLFLYFIFRDTKKRVMGIEPTYPAWKAGVLPLNYTRIIYLFSLTLNTGILIMWTPVNLHRMRKKRLELSQDKLPLEPESSASAIPPLPLDK